MNRKWVIMAHHWKPILVREMTYKEKILVSQTVMPVILMSVKVIVMRLIMMTTRQLTTTLRKIAMLI